MHDGPAANDGDRRELLESTVATVLRILERMGIANASENAVLAAPPFYDGSILLETRGRFAQFNAQLAVQLRFVGYAFEEVALLSVRELAEMYVRDSHPPLPGAPLANEQYHLDFGRPAPKQAGSARDFPICFVLGSPRSGTTLLRAMLDMHTELWAPGELHLANYETMAERANRVAAVLRYMPIPEAATRCGEATADFARRFRSWELEATPVPEVFQHLHDSDPGVMIVDKSPPYCVQLETLKRIGECFPRAKFVQLVRSPHDVIRSYVRMQLQRGDRRLFEPGLNPYQAAEAIWFACNSSSEAFLASLPSDRKCVVRYEELTSAPAACLTTICQLLEREFQPGMADPYARPGATVQGAGDLHIHLLESVESREPIAPFYPLGSRCQELAARYAY